MCAAQTSKKHPRLSLQWNNSKSQTSESKWLQLLLIQAHVAAEADLKVPYPNELPSRAAQLAALRDTEEFDVLVVGGGATGAGCALDAVTRSEYRTL